MLEHFDVGNSWMSYAAPIVSAVSPAQVDAGVMANISILGSNFGDNISDISVILEGSSKIPCIIVSLKDSQIECFLTPADGQQSMGDMVISVGSDWSGGSQSSQKTDATKITESPTPVELEASLPLNINDFPEGSTQAEDLKTTFVNDVVSALGIPASRVVVTGLKSGSIIVVFIILPDLSSTTAASPASLAVNLAAQASDPSVCPPGFARIQLVYLQREVVPSALQEGLLMQWSHASLGSKWRVCHHGCS